MEITRRSLLGASAAVGAGLMLPLRMTTSANAAVPAGVTPFTEQLPTLADLGIINATGGGTATIDMVNATHKFHSALAATPTFAYRAAGGSQNYLGPVIVAKRGQSFNLTVTNSITSHPLASAIDDALEGVIPGPGGDRAKPRTSTHLHGGNTPPQFDGDPIDTFTTSNTYTYDNTQEAAGLWYHDHAVGITRLNVFAGLASGYLIRDDNDPGDGPRADGTTLPRAPYEVPLVIQDRQFNNNGTFDYPPNLNPTTPRAWAPEFFGDVATVNGAIWPNLNVDRGKYRFRVYNGSNARFYNVRFISGKKNNALTFFQIGTDGGLLDASVPLNQLLLAPGERADLVVDFAGLPLASTVVLTNDAVTPFPNGPRKFKKGGAPLPQIMQFTVSAGPGWQTPLPAVLRQPITSGSNTTGLITRLAGKPLARTRSMSLVEILDAAGAPVMALLNNRTFNNSDSITYTPPVNNLVTNNPPILSDTLEQWDLINTTGDAHPIHLHFTQFQVLNRQAFNAKAYVAAAYGPPPLVQNTGNYLPPPVTQYLKGGPTAPPANEQGWKDTVTAMPGEVTRILVPFGANAVPGSPMAIGASHTGDYVWHCHILEHEDNDMMQRYVIQ